MSEQEAVWFTLDWKVPCVLFYSSAETIAHDGKDITVESMSFNPFIHVSVFEFSPFVFRIFVELGFFVFLHILGHFQSANLQK